MKRIYLKAVIWGIVLCLIGMIVWQIMTLSSVANGQLSSGIVLFVFLPILIYSILLLLIILSIIIVLSKKLMRRKDNINILNLLTKDEK